MEGMSAKNKLGDEPPRLTILGPIAESQLALAMTISGGNAFALVSSPMSIAMVALTLFVLAAPVWAMWKDRRRAAS